MDTSNGRLESAFRTIFPPEINASCRTLPRQRLTSRARLINCSYAQAVAEIVHISVFVVKRGKSKFKAPYPQMATREMIIWSVCFLAIKHVVILKSIRVGSCYARHFCGEKNIDYLSWDENILHRR